MVGVNLITPPLSSAQEFYSVRLDIIVFGLESPSYADERSELTNRDLRFRTADAVEWGKINVASIVI
jgi:hypothetical protein